MTAYLGKLANVKKLVIYLASALIEAATEAHLVPDRYVHYVQLTVFFLTSIGIYAARNAPSVDSAVAAGAQAVSTATSGGTPTFDELKAQLDALKDPEPESLQG